MSAEEVARIVGKRPGTVRVLQHRALRTLARSMAERTDPARRVTP
jgi:DNA-directed RNA polymerase specialized sigma24 family protein